MKEYHVDFPIIARVVTAIDAESEEEAKEKVKALLSGLWLRLTDDHSKESGTFIIDEWDFPDAITKGNVFYGPINEWSVEEI
jgi:hypothetical protein